MTDYGLEDSNFGCEEPFRVGIEEELLLVGSDNEPLNRVRQAIEEARGGDEGIDPELFRSMVEVRSEASPNVASAAAKLRDLRRELLESGSRLLGAGLHPNAQVEDAVVDIAPRYALIAQTLQGVLRIPICGQHIHVGMPDVETAVRAYNGIRTYVPVLDALAANSPFWFGRDSGLASARTVIFRSYPRAAMAPEVADFSAYKHVVRQVCVAGQLEDYTHIWWDVRIHPKLGTIEIRAPDAQFDLRRSAAISALAHCLCRIEAGQDQSRMPAREALAESVFQSTRYGLDAVLLDRDGQAVAARELAKRALDRSMEVAEELSCVTELEYVETILEQGSGADLQRRAHAEGGMRGLLAFLVRETADLGTPSPVAEGASRS